MSELQGSLSPEWYDCFPVESVAALLSYVVSSWVDLSARFPLAHHAQEAEPNLTKSLADHLDDAARRRAAGVGGRFHCERPLNERDATGRRKQQARTDIEYHLPRDGRATLVLEFKKLKGTNNWRQAYRDQGVMRFVNGPYATMEIVGVMCGFVSSDLMTETSAVRTSLHRNRLKLACVADGAGAHVFAPSTIAPGVASFDTRHARLAPVASSPILLGHVFLAIAAEAPTR